MSHVSDREEFECNKIMLYSSVISINLNNKRQTNRIILFKVYTHYFFKRK